MVLMMVTSINDIYDDVMMLAAASGNMMILKRIAASTIAVSMSDDIQQNTDVQN